MSKHPTQPRRGHGRSLGPNPFYLSCFGARLFYGEELQPRPTQSRSGSGLTAGRGLGHRAPERMMLRPPDGDTERRKRLQRQETNGETGNGGLKK